MTLPIILFLSGHKVTTAGAMLTSRRKAIKNIKSKNQENNCRTPHPNVKHSRIPGCQA